MLQKMYNFQGIFWKTAISKLNMTRGLFMAVPLLQGINGYQGYSGGGFAGPGAAAGAAAGFGGAAPQVRKIT
jgi:hypothetical protein